MEPQLLCSSFLCGKQVSPEHQLAVVLLNWTLPELTPRLWHAGEPPAGSTIADAGPATPWSTLLH
jgi:hypothetical protein